MLINFADDKTISYFRGRKLHGKQLKVPKGYRGVVLSSTDRTLPKKPLSVTAEDDQDTEETPEVKVMEEQSEFDDLMVWGHEALPEDTSDPYVRGMEEWIAFAKEVRCPTKSLRVLSNNHRFIRLNRRTSQAAKSQIRWYELRRF
jgi:ribonuclease H2 subunit C